MIHDRTERLSALAELLRSWTRVDASSKIDAYCNALDIVWMMADAESRQVQPRRRRKAKASLRNELAKIKAPIGACIVHYGDIAEEIATAFKDPLPVVKKERRPPKYAADAAIRSALSAYEALTGIDAARKNSQITFGISSVATERGGRTLAFCKALDAFYDLKLSTDTRIAEGICDLNLVGLPGSVQA